MCISLICAIAELHDKSTKIGINVKQKLPVLKVNMDKWTKTRHFSDTSRHGGTSQLTSVFTIAKYRLLALICAVERCSTAQIKAKSLYFAMVKT